MKLKEILNSRFVLVFGALFFVAAMSYLDRSYFDHQNLLTNPGFESGKAGWTCTGGTPAVTSSNVHGGTQAYSIGVVSQSASCYQDVTPNEQIGGVALEAGMWVKTAMTGVQVCDHIGGTNMQCLSVPASGVWTYVVMNVTGSAGQSVGVGIYTSPVTTGTVYFDDAYVGDARGIGSVAQALDWGSMSLTGTAAGGNTCAFSVTTASSSEATFASFGSSTNCNAWTTTGNMGPATTNSIAIPLGNTQVGTYRVHIHGAAFVYNGTTAGAVCNFQLLDPDGVTTPMGQIYLPVTGSQNVPELDGSFTWSTAKSRTLTLQASSSVSGTQCGLLDNVAGRNLRIDVDYFPTQNQAAIAPQNIIDRTGEHFFVAGSCPAGTVPGNGGSIGNTGSSATYVGPSFYNLYSQIWGVSGLTTTAGQPYVISSAKGASASADWIANKTITFNLGGYFLRSSGGSAGTIGAAQGQSTAVNGLHDNGHQHNQNTGIIAGTAANSNGVYSPPSVYISISNGGGGNGNFLQTATGFASLAGDSETRPVNVGLNLCINPQTTQPMPIILSAPTRTVITASGCTPSANCSGSTYQTPTGARYLKVKMVGAGGGGSGSSNASNNGGNGGNGGNTTFGTSLLVSNGGAGAQFNNAGNGGTASLGTGPLGLAITGATGSAVYSGNGLSSFEMGGSGGASPFGGNGTGNPNAAGIAAAATSGSGGGGAGGPNPGLGGGGGGAGGYVDAQINSPSASYSFAVGTGGTAGTAGTSGFAGGAGGSGVIIIDEFYH